MTESDLTRNSDYLLTESAIDKNIPLDAVLCHLKKRGTSGTLYVDFQNGGIRSVRLAERYRMPEISRDSVRKILKME